MCQHTDYLNTADHRLNCFNHEIYMYQTSMYQNIAKLLTHPSTFISTAEPGLLKKYDHLIYTKKKKKEKSKKEITI